MLTLRLIAADGEDASLLGERRFEAGRLTIGRGPDRDWVLPCPGQKLSRHHCSIESRAGGYVVVDSSLNGTFLNDATERLDPGAETALRDGDRLRMAHFLFEVFISAGNPLSDFDELMADPTPAGRPLTAPPRSPPPVRPVLDDGLAQGDDPLFPILGAARPAPAATPVGSMEDLLAPVRQAQPPAAGRPPPASPPAPPSASVADDGPVTAQQPVLLLPDDWDSDPPDDPDATVDIRAPMAMPPATEHPAVPAGAPDGGRSGAVLVRALLEGAGVDGIDPEGVDAEAFLRQTGALLREAVGGLHDVLASRAMVKTTLRMERTVGQAAGNNPLKLNPDKRLALARILDHPAPGHLSGLEAVREASHDVRVHEMALMGAVDVALRRLIQRFDPDQLKQRFEDSSLLDRIVPAARKARYWEVYETLYERIAREVDDDFHSAFGQAAAEIYQENLAAAAEEER